MQYASLCGGVAAAGMAPIGTYHASQYGPLRGLDRRFKLENAERRLLEYSTVSWFSISYQKKNA